MKRVPVALVALLVLALAAISQTLKVQKHHVVMEMSVGGPEVWQGVVTHINVLRNAFGNDIDIEVVCMGEGLAMCQKSDTKLQAALQTAAENGVIFAACQNSMRKRNVKTEDLFPFTSQVPAGIAEVVMKQEAGYSYLKVAAE
jgi:intracellular sulfur oxidation DsrE/DsrF family protein